MATPVLLLRPAASRNAGGPIAAPTVNGSVGVVAGQYADAWELTGGYLTTPENNVMPLTAGTLFLRGWLHPTQSFSPHFIFGFGPAGGSSNEINMHHLTAGNWLSRIGQNQLNAGPLAHDTPFCLTSRWGASNVTTFLNGVQTNQAVRSGIAMHGGNLGLGALANGFQPMRGRIESVLIVDGEETSAEILRIATMPTAWTWENVQGIVETPDRPELRKIMDISGVLPHIGPHGRSW